MSSQFKRKAVSYKRGPYNKKKKVLFPLQRSLSRAVRLGMPKKVYPFVRCSSTVIYDEVPNSTNVIQSTTGTGTEYGFAFRLTDVPNASEFTALFDQYRIQKVVVTFHPRASAMSTTTQIGNSLTGRIMTAIDHDDNAAIGGGTWAGIRDALNQYQTCRTHVPQRTFSRVIYPQKRVAGIDIAGALANTGTGSRSWTDCAVASALWYGLRVGVQNTTSTGDIVMDVSLKYYLQFRDVR